MGILNSRWLVKKLETIGVNMPEIVTLKLLWGEDDHYTSPSYFDMYRVDIEEMMMNYGWDQQALLFTFTEIDIWKEWIWDQLCREPKEVEIVDIKY